MKKKNIKAAKVKCSIMLTKKVYDGVAKAALADRRPFSTEIDMRLESTLTD